MTSDDRLDYLSSQLSEIATKLDDLFWEIRDLNNNLTED